MTLFSVLQLRTDSEKRSLAESGLNWYGEPEEKTQKKMDYDSGSLKMEHSSSKWRRERSESCDEAPAKGGELKKPVSLGPPGSLKKGKTPPVAVTSPITHTAQTLKVAGEIVIEIILLTLFICFPFVCRVQAGVHDYF